MGSAGYPPDFEAAWAEYKNPKNASKSMAYSYWLKLKERKDWPGQELMLGCIMAYNQWLEEQWRANKNGYPAKAHMSTFLSPKSGKWEGFMDDAEGSLASGKAAQAHIQADQSAAAKSWEGPPGEAIKHAMWAMAPEGTDWSELLDRWIWPAVFISGQIPEIKFPSSFHRDYVEVRFGKIIRRAFGQDVKLTTSKP